MFDQSGSMGNTHWERQTLQRVLLEHIQEQKRSRRWGIFFKLVFLILFITTACWLFFKTLTAEAPPPIISVSRPHVAVIDVRGEIMEDQDASASNIRTALKMAFDNKYVKAVIFRINSPGGSPVQARQIYDQIQLFKARNTAVKVYAAIEDTGTSAAYLIASGCDGIYADKTSLVGSIGVRLDSFGFVDAMNKLGIERRLYAAGKFKGLLDPFSPRDEAGDAFVKEQLALIHQAFIQNVREGRGDRLKETPETFTGLFWTGEQALTMGLIDGYGDAYFVAREIVKSDELVDYTPTSSLLDRLANRIGASAGKNFVQSLNNSRLLAN